MPAATTPRARSIDQPAKTQAASRKRRGFFRWFFSAKDRPQPVRVDAVNSSQPSTSGTAETRPPERRKPSETALARLEKGYAEVTELVHALRQHIDRQADRSERLLLKMDHLPEALQALPKVNETNNQLLQTMQEHLHQQQEHSKRLTSVIEGIVQASKHRDDAIDMMRQQMAATQEKDIQLMNGFTTLGHNMSKICDFQQKSASVLDKVMQMGAQAEQRMRDMLEINKRNARTLALSGWALVVVSLALTGFVAVAATRLASYPTSPAQPAAMPTQPKTDTPSTAQRPAPLNDTKPAAGTLDHDTHTTKTSINHSAGPSSASTAVLMQGQPQWTREDLTSILQDVENFVTQLPGWTRLQNAVRSSMLPNHSKAESSDEPSPLTEPIEQALDEQTADAENAAPHASTTPVETGFAAAGLQPGSK